MRQTSGEWRVHTVSPSVLSSKYSSRISSIPSSPVERVNEGSNSDSLHDKSLSVAYGGDLGTFSVRSTPGSPSEGSKPQPRQKKAEIGNERSLPSSPPATIGQTSISAAQPASPTKVMPEDGAFSSAPLPQSQGSPHAVGEQKPSRWLAEGTLAVIQGISNKPHYNGLHVMVLARLEDDDYHNDQYDCKLLHPSNAVDVKPTVVIRGLNLRVLDSQNMTRVSQESRVAGHREQETVIPNANWDPAQVPVCCNDPCAVGDLLTDVTCCMRL
jgi:hypothetical protein